MNKDIEKDVIITCKRVRYFTEIDEDYFFDWLKQIPSIYKIDGRHDELYLYIKPSTMTDQELINLYALFKRYKIPKIMQLKALRQQKK